VPIVCKQCHWCAKHVGGINLWANTGLFGIKLVGGIFGNSQALIADAVHSLSDIVISLMLLVSLRVSSTPPDEDHSWGHGNVEFIVSVIIGVLLICTAVTITLVSLVSILAGITYDPGVMAVWAAALSVVSNEILFRHGICVGEQFNSPAMIANAWEKRSDAYSSFAALIGVFGASIGFQFLDPLAAIVVGFMIARAGIGTLITGIRGITDQTSDRAMLKEVKRLVLQEDQVKNIGRLRARKIGQKDWVDIEAKFDPQIKVRQVKEIIVRVRKRIMDQFEGLGDVVIVSRVSEPELKET